MTFPAGFRARSRVPLTAAAALVFGTIAAVHGLTLVARLMPQSPAAPAALTAWHPPAPERPAIEPAAGPEDIAPDSDQSWMGRGATLDEQGDLRCHPRLLEAIDERQRQLDARTAELVERARMLEVIEKRASEQIRALSEERRALETVLKAAHEVADEEMKRLVAIYENMKPKDAAKIFEAMPADVAAGLILHMREVKSAPVLANLGANHAYAITLALAARGALLRDR